MLSRRRSSEQTHTLPPGVSVPSSPSLQRVDAALRGVNVLFSTIAYPENPAPYLSLLVDPTASPPPSPQGNVSINNNSNNQKLPTPVPPTPPTPPARRRLFASRGGPVSPIANSLTSAAASGNNVNNPNKTGPNRLVVAAAVKNPSNVRLYQVTDIAGTRVTVSKAWNLSDLHKIDGLGLDVSESTVFALFFSSNKMLVWRTRTPFSRATFLWALMQTCATRLKRAPPSTRLKLLDLQTFADRPPPPSSQASSAAAKAGAARARHRSRSDPHAAAAAAARMQHMRMRMRNSGVSGTSGVAEGNDRQNDDDDDKSGRNNIGSGGSADKAADMETEPGFQVVIGRPSDDLASEVTDGYHHHQQQRQHRQHQDGPTSSTTQHATSSVDDATLTNQSRGTGSGGAGARRKRTGVVDLRARRTMKRLGPQQQQQGQMGSNTTDASATSPPQRLHSPQRNVKPPVRNDGSVGGGAQRVTRTLSEPKVSSSIPTSVVDSPVHQPMTVFPGRSRRVDGNNVRGNGHSDNYADAGSGYRANGANGVSRGIHNVSDTERAYEEDYDVNNNERKHGDSHGGVAYNRNEEGLYDNDDGRDEGDDELLDDQDDDDEDDDEDGDDSNSGGKWGGDRWVSRPRNKRKNGNAERNMNIDERAFLAAAKRMGVNDLSPMCKAEVIEQFASVGSEAKGRLRRTQAANTSNENGDNSGVRNIDDNSMKLTRTELDDLVYALDLFRDNAPNMSLADFGAWADTQIQTLEVDNISDIVDTEERHKFSNNNKTRKFDSLENEDDDYCNPYEVLVKEVKQVEPWLEKNETLLAPYARLANDIHSDVQQLEIQRHNVDALEAQLQVLLQAVTLNETEQELMNDLDAHILDRLLTDPDEANYTEVFQAIELIASRIKAINALPKPLSSMKAVQDVRHIMRERQARTSRALLPCLQRFIDVQYHMDNASFRMTADNVRLNMALHFSNTVFSEFLKGLHCLVLCGDVPFTQLIDHYVNISAAWIRSVVRLSMRESVKKLSKQNQKRTSLLWMSGIDQNEKHTNMNDESETSREENDTEKGCASSKNETFGSLSKQDVDDHAAYFIDALFYACLSEAFRAFRFFSRVLDDAKESNGTSTSSSNITKLWQLSSPLHISSPPSFPPTSSPVSSPSLLSLSSISTVTLGDIMERHVPDITFLEDWLHQTSGDNGRLHSCLLLHASYALKAWNEMNDARAVVTRIETRLDLDVLSPPVGYGYSRTRFDTALSSSHDGQTPDQQYHRHVICAYNVDAAAASPPLSRADSLSSDGPVLRVFLPRFRARLRQIAIACSAAVDAQVNATIAALSTSRDMKDAGGRASFFMRVRECVDLCMMLTSYKFQAQPVQIDTRQRRIGREQDGEKYEQKGRNNSKRTSAERTKELREKLIAAAMRNTEVISANVNGEEQDMVKLQSYSYIASRLDSQQQQQQQQQQEHDHEQEDSLVLLAKRVRRHVVRKWIEDHVFDIVLGPAASSTADLLIKRLSLTVDKDSATTTDRAKNEVCERMAREVAAEMIELIDRGMEAAATTCAAVGVYAELVTSMKERMEELLRQTRKDKSAVPELRLRLLAFSREVLTSIQSKHDQAQTQFTKIVQ